MGKATITLEGEPGFRSMRVYSQLGFRMVIGREFTEIAYIALLNEWRYAGNFPDIASEKVFELKRECTGVAGLTLEGGLQKELTKAYRIVGSALGQEESV